MIKKPIDAEPVTIPTDIVLFLSEKYFPTAATGTETAVPPSAVPITTPILIRKTELEDDQTTFKKTDIKKFFIDKASWNDIFLSLDLTPGTRQLISHCSFSHIDELVVYFSLPEDKLKLLGGKHRKEFQESLCIKFNKELDIFYEPSAHNEDSPNVIKEKISQQKQQDLENSIRDDPNVQLILNDFEANIIDSSIKEKK